MKFPRSTCPWKSECFKASERGGFSKHSDILQLSYDMAIVELNLTQSMNGGFVSTRRFVACAVSFHAWSPLNTDQPKGLLLCEAPLRAIHLSLTC